MSSLIYIAVGGAAGALLRYSVSGITYKYFDGLLPWGTLAVNMIGCFAIGLLWQLFELISTSPNTQGVYIYRNPGGLYDLFDLQAREL